MTPSDSPNSEPIPQATIVIVTRNRKEMAGKAVESAKSQSGNNQVLVIDDGSTDGTAGYLRELFPTAKVITYPDPAGYIVRRNQGCEQAAGPIVFSIDDDAVYSDTEVIQDVLKAFDDPAVAVAMIPHINCSPEDVPGWYAPLAPEDGQRYVTNTFIGTGYALRRELFNRLGGYQTKLYHWGEEAEFSQRLIDSGHVVLMGTRHRVRHYPHGPGKYTRENLRFVWRNRILSVWYNAPLVLLLPLLSLQIMVAILKAYSTRGVSLEGTLVGLKEIPAQWSMRKAVGLRAYRLWFELRKRKMAPLEEIRPRLPKAC